MQTADVYLQHAKNCQRMAAQAPAGDARSLRLREARDWLALAAAHAEARMDHDNDWSPLEPLHRRDG
jgi:hypothetical protein